MNPKELTQSILAVLIVGGAIASFFFPVEVAAAQVIRVLAGSVVGFYYGAGTLPAFGRRA